MGVVGFVSEVLVAGTHARDAFTRKMMLKLQLLLRFIAEVTRYFRSSGYVAC